MENTHTSPVDEYKTLKSTLEGWEKQQLVQYALKLTKALKNEQNAVQHNNNSAYRLTQTLPHGPTLIEEISQSIASTLDLDEVLIRILRLINEAMSVSEGSILLAEESSGDLVFQTSLGSIAKKIKPFRVPRGQGIAGEVAQTGVPIRIENAQEDRRHFKQIDRDTGFLTRSILCVPLIARGKVIGVVETFNKKSGPFTAEDEALLGTISSFAAIAIENARLHQKVIAERDRVIQAQEEVSRKLQRDLHDGPTQLVAALQMSIDFCQQGLKKNISVVGPELEQMQQLTQRAIHQMRTLLFELRPLVLETEGLTAALKTFIERRQKSEKTTLHLIVQVDRPDEAVSRLKAKYEAALFAITQEAVNNSLKYAKANNIFVRLHQAGNRLEVIILDDGLGFDLQSVTQNYENRGSYGMVNLKERVDLLGGQHLIKTAPGAGTEICIKVKLTPELLLEGED